MLTAEEREDDQLAIADLLHTLRYEVHRRPPNIPRRSGVDGTSIWLFLYDVADTPELLEARRRAMEEGIRLYVLPVFLNPKIPGTHELIARGLKNLQEFDAES